MLAQCSIGESPIHGLTESPIHALQGNQSQIIPFNAFKVIQFASSNPVGFFSTLYGILNANVNAIMALMFWSNDPINNAGYFAYDFDAHPTFAIGNGVISYGNVGGNTVSNVSANPYGPHQNDNNPTPNPPGSFFPLDGYPVYQDNPGGIPMVGLNQTRKGIQLVWRLYGTGYAPVFVVTIQTTYAFNLIAPSNFNVNMVVPPPDVGPAPPAGSVVLEIPIPAYQLLMEPISLGRTNYFIQSANTPLNV